MRQMPEEMAVVLSSPRVLAVGGATAAKGDVRWGEHTIDPRDVRS